MYIYEMPDIRNSIENLISKNPVPVIELKKVIFKFFNDIDENLRKRVIYTVLQEAECSVKVSEFFKFLQDEFNDAKKFGIKSGSDLDRIICSIAGCSDDEECCGGRIYVIVKGMDIVKEYNSWEEAEHDIDEWYISCCDDAYIAECVLFQLLCYVQSREWDKLINFCTVIEFDATNIECGRESWENNNCM